jgi:hypothetical protein
MRSLLTGYAGGLNRRHQRGGHLFQNRYKSSVVEEEPYLLELVRYLHLNPVRAQVVPDSGRSIGTPGPGTARCWGACHAPGRRPGRSWRSMAPRYPGRDGPTGPSWRTGSPRGAGRISKGAAWCGVRAAGRAWPPSDKPARPTPGMPGFWEAAPLWCTCSRSARPISNHHRPPARSRRSGRGCAPTSGSPPGALYGGGRLPAVSRARAGIAYLWVERLGRPGRPLAPVLGLHPTVVYQAARRGAAQAREWEAVLATMEKTT